MRKENVVNKKGLSSRKSFVRDLPSAKSLLNKEQPPYYMKQAEGPGQRPAGTTTFFYNGGFTPALVIPVLAVRAHAGYSAGRKSGFTLIELLVVVLIIGILASVALPQYKIAVAKARMTQLLTLGDATRKAEEIYYMANGQYTNNWEELDIGISGTPQSQDTIKINNTITLYLRTNPNAISVSDSRIPAYLIIGFNHQNNDPAFEGKTCCYTSKTNSIGITLCKQITDNNKTGSDDTSLRYCER